MDKYVSHNIAKNLIVAGFNELCELSYEFDNCGLTLKITPNLKRNDTCEIGEITAPYFYDLDEWLFEKHKIVISRSCQTGHYYFNKYNGNGSFSNYYLGESKEDAYLEAIEDIKYYLNH